jgi:cell division protein FtsZ
MPQIRPNVETFARIKVIGVGGSGQNAVDHMIDSDIDGVDYICINTDTQHLDRSRATKKIHIGKNLTKGIGSGMNPDVGRESAEETKADIQEVLKDADMVFVACGMGGGTGTGASPVVARMAREQGILTIGVVTRPFSFEGERRIEIANQGIDALQHEVDALIVISNDRLLAVTDKNTSFKEAFQMCDNVLLDAVKSIADLISDRQTINIDFADIRAVLSNAGSAYVGIGLSSGDDRAAQAAHDAINSSLLDVSISGAKGVLLAIATSPDDLKMFEVDMVARMVRESIAHDARFIFGPVEDPRIKKGDLKVTIVATGFDGKSNISSTQTTRSSSSQQYTTESSPQSVPISRQSTPDPVTMPTEPLLPLVNPDQAPTLTMPTPVSSPLPATPTLIATDPLEPRFSIPPQDYTQQTNTNPEKSAFGNQMPNGSMMPAFEPDVLEDAPKPLEVLDDLEPDDDRNTRFPAFIRRNK